MEKRPALTVERTKRSERGQALILWMLAATVIFIIGVIVVDFGLWLSERRRAQTAADLAALAAAAQLDVSDAAAQAAGLDFANRNGYDDNHGAVEVTVTPNYTGNPELVEVTIKQGSQALFLSLLDDVDLAGVDIGARAVGTRTVSTTPTRPPGILALEDNCSGDALIISGSDVDVTGVTHTNGEITVSGSNGTFTGPTRYGCSPPELNEPSNSYNPSATQASARTNPLPYDSYSSFISAHTCNVQFSGNTDLGSENSVWLNDDPNTKQLKQWVICVDGGKLTLSAAGVTGTNVTLVAEGELDISGNNFNLHANTNANEVLLFSGSNSGSAMTLSGGNGQWWGYLMAPNGKLKISGSGSDTFNASLIGNQVEISSQNLSINSFQLHDPSGGEPVVHLVE